MQRYACLAVSTLLLLAAVFIPLAAAQRGKYLLQHNSDVTRSNSPVSININNAKSWGTGASNTFKPIASACNEYRVQLTVGVKFISLTVTNPNVCTFPVCDYSSYGNPGCRWARSNVVAPFSITWLDVSTTATIVLPTRQNAPGNIGMEPMTVTIPDALDRTLVTNAMRLVLTIRPYETTYLEFTQYRWYYMSCSPDRIPPACVPYSEWWYREMYLTMQRSGAHRSVGAQGFSQAREYPNGNFPGWLTLRRKQPTAPNMFKLRYGGGCGYQGWSPPPVNPCGWFNKIWDFPVYQYNSVRKDIHNTVCDDYYWDCDDGTSLFVWEFYEDYRQHQHKVTVDRAALESVVFDPANNFRMDVVALPPDPNTTKFQTTVRLVWRNLTEYTDADPAVESERARETIGVYVVPPFQMQDLWVTVHTDAGVRVFTDMERRVPYRSPTDPAGHVGWQFALNRRFDSATEYTIAVRYNRQTNLGQSEEERRANLLRGFVEDNDGDVDDIAAPIPKTVISEEGLMGAVFSGSTNITAGTQFGSITWQSCLTSNSSTKYYKNHLVNKLNLTHLHYPERPLSTDWYEKYEKADDPRYQTELMMALMLVTDAVSESDYSTAFWAVSDAYYPQKPTMVPTFWDPIQVQRLLGFSEIPYMSAQLLGNWSEEHAAITAAWPWFGVEVSVEKWQYFRAHVRRSLLEGPDGQLFLAPYVHLWRHSNVAPNVRFEVDWVAKRINFIADGSGLDYMQELYPDFNAGSYYKHEYFMRYGAVPNGAVDSCTVPSWDGFLTTTRSSRDVLREYWEELFNENHRNALQRIIAVLGIKQASLPVVVDGLGSTPDQVNTAMLLLQSEKTVISWQLADANSELASL